MKIFRGSSRACQTRQLMLQAKCPVLRQVQQRDPERKISVLRGNKKYAPNERIKVIGKTYIFAISRVDPRGNPPNYTMPLPSTTRATPGCCMDFWVISLDCDSFERKQ